MDDARRAEAQQHEWHQTAEEIPKVSQVGVGRQVAHLPASEELRKLQQQIHKALGDDPVGHHAVLVPLRPEAGREDPIHGVVKIRVASSTHLGDGCFVHDPALDHEQHEAPEAHDELCHVHPDGSMPEDVADGRAHRDVAEDVQVTAGLQGTEEGRRDEAGDVALQHVGRLSEGLQLVMPLAPLHVLGVEGAEGVAAVKRMRLHVLQNMGPLVVPFFHGDVHGVGELVQDRRGCL
mmetsp:Transcript_48636/g.115785  ORF Transcript_48636/g.115785 Transcript_48636/m.115785 type:complete len:235 (-) Transcript_48636:876-1580(-)